MHTGIILSQSDIKKIIAKYFNVPEEKVMQSKYSFIVIKEEKDGRNKES